MLSLAEITRLTVNLSNKGAKTKSNTRLFFLNMGTLPSATIDHFTVVCEVTSSEAGGDLALIPASLLLSFKYGELVGTNNLLYATKAVRSVSEQVNYSLVVIQRP